MSYLLHRIFLSFLILGLIVPVFASASSTDGTIDSIYKYAWGENIGWLNFGTTEGNVHITDSELTGYVWGENTGWISLNCSNDSSCATVDYKVSNDNEGNLSGYAWSENTGWINFNPTYGGVSIDSSGNFSGYAWGENIGWIIFNCSTTNSCGTVDYKVKTDWRPRSSRPACNNSIDDDGDGLTDYPNDPGCDSLTDTDETDLTTTGGGLPAGAYNPPAPPAQGFKVLINDDALETNSRTVVLTLKAGSNTAKMAVSNFSNFQHSGQESYQTSKTWTLTKGMGLKTVYAKFYTRYGVASEVVSDSIIYRIKTEPSEETEEETSKEEQIPYGTGEIPAEQVAKLPPAEVTPPVEKPQKPFTPKDKLRLPTGLVEKVPEILKPLVPEFLKPKPSGRPEDRRPPKITPEEIPIEELVPKKTPLVFQNNWDLLPGLPIEKFVLAPLPKEIRELVQKFPKLEKTFEEIGISKITDTQKLRIVKLTLPGLTESVGLERAASQRPYGAKFALPKAIPVAKLLPKLKQAMPTEIVFAKTAGELIDFNIALTIGKKGETRQKITTISNKPLQLVIKPDKPVKSVKGYMVWKSKKISRMTNNKFPIFNKTPNAKVQNPKFNIFFAKPAFAQEHNPAEIKKRLILLEFEYTDPDDDGIYTAEIQAPKVSGEYEIITVMDFASDPTAVGQESKPLELKKEIRLIIAVDPEGYVYERDGDKETRIPGAIVSIYWLNPSTKQYELWPAKEYNQENQQVTDTTGKYSFLVPEGSYYLKVEAPGYLIYDGKPFQVREGSGVHINIELKTKYWWLKVVDWKTILLIVVILLLVYNFYRDKIREKIYAKRNIK